MVGGWRLVLADVDREDVITAVVEVCCDGRADARSSTDNHDLASLVVHSTNPSRRTMLSA
jgi:hypothetical protein